MICTVIVVFFSFCLLPPYLLSKDYNKQYQVISQHECLSYIAPTHNKPQMNGKHTILFWRFFNDVQNCRGVNTEN